MDRVRSVPLTDPELGVLSKAVGSRSRIRDSELDRLANAHDASHFLLVPRALAIPETSQQVAALMRACSELGLEATFRSGGTSLSGQGLSDSLLVDVRRNFRGIEVLDEGRRVRVEPGATVRQVNVALARHGHALGPDPASQIACTIGGVIANNSSGMACGTAQNSYKTLESLSFVLPSGTMIDTSRPDADQELRAREPILHEAIERLRSRVWDDPDSVRTIERLFSIKNTMGYSLNAFLDFVEPVEILARLMVGSEGTLGFIASAVFSTVVVQPAVATGLAVFDDLERATQVLPEIVDSGAAIVELLDATSLRVASRDARAQALLPELVGEPAALLIEYHAESADHLDEVVKAASVVLRKSGSTAELTTDRRLRADWWAIRKGLYAAVASSRPSGTTALLEDIAVPVHHLSETCRELTGMFDLFGYRDSVIFGHAKDGNIHFMLTDDFEDARRLEVYQEFTEMMVDLVLSHGGTLKAEHGTGRTMAPFVERQYGAELYDVIREIKHAVDPARILNPGVVVGHDPRAHVRNLKTNPRVDVEVDACVECGYCEPVCPSRDLTTTPRQRIVLRRELARAEERGDRDLAARLRSAMDYEVVQTCAADGMCQTACPVSINTGDLVKRLRSEAGGKVSEYAWKQAARHWRSTVGLAARGLTIAAALPPSIPSRTTAALRRAMDPDVVPQWTPDLPSGGRPRPTSRSDPGSGNPVAVYFSSCTGAMFGSADRAEVMTSDVTGAVVELCERAGVPIVRAHREAELCCGTPWRSKGKLDGLSVMRDKVATELERATDSWRLPIMVDASSCAEGLATLVQEIAGPRAVVVSSVDFVLEHVMPLLPVVRPFDSVALHPTCASVRAGSHDSLERLARLVAREVEVPDSWACCGFAGDRGLLHPELTASATAAEAAEVRRGQFSAYASDNRTCEMAMSRATGQSYRHVLVLALEATSSADS